MAVRSILMLRLLAMSKLVSSLHSPEQVENFSGPLAAIERPWHVRSFEKHGLGSEGLGAVWGLCFLL